MEWITLFYLSVASFLSLTAIVKAAEGCANENCRATTGDVCNGHGTCDCGVCQCEGSYSGPTCEECPTCPSPCETYRECVSCKIFMTGSMGLMECIQVCDKLASFFPVEKKDMEPERVGDMTVCRRVNERNCIESFKVGGMTDGYRDLYVQTQMECEEVRPRPIIPIIPTSPPTTTEWTTNTEWTTESTTTTGKEEISTEVEMEDKNPTSKPEVAKSASGSGKISDSNIGNSAGRLQLSVYACLCVFVTIL